MSKQLQIRIYPNGKVEARTKGVKGKGCTDYIKVLEQLLEARTKEFVHTDEYHQEEILEAMQEDIIAEEREK